MLINHATHAAVACQTRAAKHYASAAYALDNGEAVHQQNLARRFANEAQYWLLNVLCK